MEEQDVLERVMDLEAYARDLKEQIDTMQVILEKMQLPLEELLETRLRSLEENTEQRVLAKLDQVLSRLEKKIEEEAEEPEEG